MPNLSLGLVDGVKGPKARVVCKFQQTYKTFSASACESLDSCLVQLRRSTYFSVILIKKFDCEAD